MADEDCGDFFLLDRTERGNAMPNPTQGPFATRAQARVSVVQPRLRLAEERVAFPAYCSFVARKKQTALLFFFGAMCAVHTNKKTVGACPGNNPLETHPDEA